MTKQIKSTWNYEQFEAHDINRDVNPESKDFKNLVKSMETHGYIPAYPLHVINCNKNGKKYQLKAGHNRLAAAQIANVPVMFVVCEDSASVYDLEKGSVGKWKQGDFFISYKKYGVPAYKELYEYVKRTGIGMANAASMFHGETAGGNNYVKYGRFNNGMFKIRNREHPELVGEIVLRLKKKGITWATNSNAVRAISKICWVPEFSAKRFLSKIDKYAHILEKQKDLESYTQAFEDLYNYRSKKTDKLNLFFRANQASKERMPIGKKA